MNRFSSIDRFIYESTTFIHEATDIYKSTDAAFIVH